MTQERIEKAAEEYFNNREGCFGLKDLETFYYAAKWASENQWISVDDELPEKDGIYFVIANNMLPLITIFNHIKGIFELEPYRSYNITHWMPIPKMKEE